MVQAFPEETKDSLRDAICKVAIDDGKYAPEAFCLVALGYLTLMRGKTIKIEDMKKKLEVKLDYAELLSYFKLLGWESFGPLAKTVFIFWKLKSGKDFIDIVDCMIEKGILEKNTLKKNAPDCYPLKDFSFDFYEQKGLMLELG